MVEVEVKSGICGFTTVIKADGKTGYKATCQIETDCPNHKKVAKVLEEEELNVMNELFKRDQSQVLAACHGNIPHVSCPVPAGILKALEVSVKLALPADASITFLNKQE